MKKERLSQVEVQQATIKGLMGDNQLGDELVLKGGNALALVHRVSDRFSQDIDFSMEGDFEDLEATQIRIEDTLKKEFSPKNYEVFDVRLEKRPKRTPSDSKWGGYSLTFKVIESVKKNELSGLDEWRKYAIIIGQKGKVEIDISKHEYTGLIAYEVIDEVEIKVLTLTAIFYEKMRAICQQMPAYPKRASKTPRARDFYDIYQIVENSERSSLFQSENLKHCRAIFEAKEVPKKLLLELDGQREFHRKDWASVTNTTANQLDKFDYYFEYVCELADNLHSHWDE